MRQIEDINVETMEGAIFQNMHIEDRTNEVDEVECLEGTIYSTNFDNPELHLGMKFKDVKKLRFCLQQYSIRKNFNDKMVKSDIL